MGKKKANQDDLKKIHRFQSFSERVASIRINVQGVKHVVESAEERGGYFGECLAKWRELNCTSDFVTFSRETHNLSSTLPQLVHHKEEIISKLKHYLQLKHTLAYEPLLDLLVQLARDLQAEFYPFFKDFFPILVSMTDTQDTDVIQCVFTSLAYLFKFLWRHMIKDIENVFSMYSELLGLSVKAHIRQFAVESFGFLLRKVRNQSALLDMIFKHLSENQDLSEGVGQLLFEMCRGVTKQFHSCADTILPLLLTKLNSRPETVFPALCKMMELMAEHTRKEFAAPLWKPLLSHLSEVCSSTECSTKELMHTLHLIGILVSWRKGSRITDLRQVSEAVVGVLTRGSLDQQALSVAVHLAASIVLVTPYLTHGDTHLTALVRGVCGVRVVEESEVMVIIEFFRELAEKYQNFKDTILSECVTFLNAVIDNGSHQNVMIKFLAELCLHFELPRYTFKGSFNPPTKFVLGEEQSPPNSALVSLLVETVSSWHDCFQEGDMETECVSIEQLWAAVLVLRHVRPCPVGVPDHLLNLFCHFHDRTDPLSGPHLLLLSQCVSTMARVTNTATLRSALSPGGLLKLLQKNPSCLPLLSSVEECLVAIDDGESPQPLTADTLKEFLPVLQCNLSSPHTAIRLVTLRILCCFEQLPCTILSGKEDMPTDECPLVNTLELCLRAEETPAQLDTYRTKILWFQKLKFSPTLSLPDIYSEVPLRYLIGSLYINLSLIWEPLIEIISTYAVESNMKPFWEVFGSFLEMSTNATEGLMVSSHCGSDDLVKWHSTVEDLFRYWNGKLGGMECGRVDHANFRFLLWKCVAGLDRTMSEPRSRILVPLVLRFAKNEYSLQEDNLMDTQDLRKNGGQQGHTETDATVKEELRSFSTDPKADTSGHKKSLYKTLTTMLSAFSKFKNPKTFYRQEELKQLCMKLLTHKMAEVQKLALSCLLTYKPPYLVPYRENFERLLKDESFREELMSFSSNSSCSVVSTDHRQKLLPILVRLLYGRMQRAGGHDSSRSGGTSRQGTVLRFLGGCEEGEMAEFIKLITLPFQDLKGSATDPARVIPLKKQQGYLNLLGQLLSTVGPNIKPYLSTLFPILVSLGASCTSLLDQRNEIQPHFVTALKALRQLVLERVSECYNNFPDYDFGEWQESVFSCLVWPQLLRLPQESLQSPTALLKLLHTWTAHQQYFHLLRTPLPSSVLTATLTGSEPQILDYVYSCLCSSGASNTVCDFILQMTLNLLPDDNDIECDGANLGTELILPHVTKLLEYLGRSIEENFKLHVDSQGAGLQLKFSLLSKVSLFVDDPAQSKLLVHLLLPFLTKVSNKYKKYEEQILLALKQLVGFCEGLSYRSFAELFGSLSARKSRACLCDIFMEIAKRDSKWTTTAGIVFKLNAWDSKRIEEPDYDLRLEGFKAATDGLSSLGVDGSSWSYDLLETTLPIVHNVLYFLLGTEDMSIRDAAASYTSTLIKHINPHDSEVFTTVILGAALSAVRQGLRSKQEFARHESISILSQLVKTYPTVQRFSDLAALSHHETEADFFENVKHIQLHRRTRAFRRLATVCTEGSMSQLTYMWFLLPLANQVVFRPSSNTEQNLLAEAVNVIEAIAAHLSWTNYGFVLGHYLRQLSKQIEIQKSLVKAVVAVLDGFHFDLLSVSTEDVQSIKSHPSTDTPTDASSMVPSSLPPDNVDKEDSVEDHHTPEDNVGSSPVEGTEISEEKSRTSAKKILKTIVNSVIPSLQGALTKKIDIAGHKLSTMGQNEDSEILRVPIAMAMTKLLLALPQESLHTHLPSLLLKVCQTLKNRSRDVRDVGRNTLVKMAAALGPKYLQYIIKEMKDSLDRGFMLHVLGYSFHSLLRGLAPQLVPGDLDPCLQLASSILVEDLFGVPAEERESGERVAKVPESKTPQSFNCYELMGSFLSPSLLPELLLPIKQKLDGGVTASTVRIVEEVFRRVGLGIHGNQAFTPQALLVFIHGLLSDSIPHLSSKLRPVTASTDSAPSLRPPDSRLLPPVPQRAGARTVAVSSTAASVVSEFGLQLLHTALKRGKFDISVDDQLSMLDPFIALLISSLSSRHVKVLSRALQSLVWLVRLPLPSLPQYVEELSSRLFELLRQYARAGAAGGANRELVLSAFKAMTVLVRDYQKHTVLEDELKLLLSFVEEDIHDYQRQSTAFPLLKAILARKLVVPEVNDVMVKVCQLLVTSDSEHVRQQCRQAMLMFLMDYPLGKKLNRYFDLFVSNLSYESQSGRESVLEMFSSMFTKFPEKILQRHSSYFFVPLASQLINDESPTCRQMVAETVKLLFKRLDSIRINDIVSILNVWIESENLLHRRLGIQTLGLLMEVEGQAFEKRLSKYLPHLISCLALYDPNSSKDDLLCNSSTIENSHDQADDVAMNECNEDILDKGLLTIDNEHMDSDHDDTQAHDEMALGENTEKPEREENTKPELSGEAAMAALDHLLFTVLTTICKLSEECTLFRGSKFTSLMTDMWESVYPLLLHPHAWVRLAACQLYGLLFSAYTPDELVTMATSRADTKKKKRRSKGRETAPPTEYILENTLSKVQDLSRSFCTQLWSPILTPELANQAVKNLVFCAKVLHRFSTPVVEESDSKDLSWLIGQFSRLARFEAGHYPKDSKKRTCVLQWTAAVCVDLGQEQLPHFLPSLLGPVYRELSDLSKRAGEELYSLAQEVAELVKGVCGREAFSVAYAKVHQSVSGVRERRRKQAALEAVVNPEKSIQRKRKKNELKKAAKKMKILRIRPDSTAAALARRRDKHKH